MKQTLFTLSLIFILFDGIGQTVSGKKISEFEAEYIYITTFSKLKGDNLVIEVDFGQKRKKTSLLKNEELPRLIDESGNEIAFDSMIEVLNLFFKNDYEYVSGFNGTFKSTDPVNCLLRKKKKLE